MCNNYFLSLAFIMYLKNHQAKYVKKYVYFTFYFEINMCVFLKRNNKIVS